MEYQIEYYPEDAIIQLTVIGEFARQDFTEFTKAAITAFEKYQSHRILLDVRQAVSKLTTVDIFNSPKAAQELGISARSKIAVVYQIQSEDYYFFENTSFNRGLNLKLFTDIQAARKWLIETPTGPTKV